MRIYLAGGEAWLDLLLDLGVKFQLLSYYYFRQTIRAGGAKVRAQLARMRMAKDQGYSFMLDSGAFSYHKDDQTGLTPPRIYWREYRDFVKDYGDLFDVIAEFDVDHAAHDTENEFGYIQVGLVDDWTNELLDIKEIAHKVMPVYHEHRGPKWMQDWLTDTRSPLLGIGSSNVHGDAKWIAYAHRFGKFVHGFAQTRIKTDLKYTPFDSVDSTTWLRADKFGGTMIFQNDKLIVLDHLHKADRRIYKQWYEKWGLDFSKIAKDDLQENRMATIITWRELANAYEKKWFFRTQGKYPYLYQLYRERKPVPQEHPLVARLRAEKEKAL